MSDDISGRIIAATVVGIVLSTFAVTARICARKVQHLNLHVDDYFIVVAFLFKIAIDIGGALRMTDLILLQNGLGRHIDTVSPSNLVTFLQVQYTGCFLYPCCISFIKLAILIQYRRIFSTRSFRCMANVLIAIIVMWCLGVCFTGAFLCDPIDKAWYPAKLGYCISLVSFYYGLQIPNVITDFAILVLPLKEVIDLDLPKGQKIGVALTCLLWLLSLIFGIIRLVVLIKLGEDGPDITYNVTNAALWTTIEPTVAIVTACLPSARVLYRAMHNGLSNRVDAERLASLSMPAIMQETNVPRSDSMNTTEEMKAGACAPALYSGTYGPALYSIWPPTSGRRQQAPVEPPKI